MFLGLYKRVAFLCFIYCSAYFRLPLCVLHSPFCSLQFDYSFIFNIAMGHLNVDLLGVHVADGI